MIWNEVKGYLVTSGGYMLRIVPTKRNKFKLMDIGEDGKDTGVIGVFDSVEAAKLAAEIIRPEPIRGGVMYSNTA